MQTTTTHQLVKRKLLVLNHHYQVDTDASQQTGIQSAFYKIVDSWLSQQDRFKSWQQDKVNGWMAQKITTKHRDDIALPTEWNESLLHLSWEYLKFLNVEKVKEKLTFWDLMSVEIVNYVFYCSMLSIFKLRLQGCICFHAGFRWLCLCIYGFTSLRICEEVNICLETIIEHKCERHDMG